MFELPPFRKCPKCKNEALGTLSVGGTMATKRCKNCGHSHGEVLPDVDKRVVYLDQFVISELYKTKTKTRRPGAPSEQFWLDCYSLANRAYLRQQVIFPTSNLHSDETIVWHSPSELRLAHEMFSGDISFEDTHSVAISQEWEFAEAYLKDLEVPSLTFDVDDILSGDRNVWLPIYHINVNSDLSIFAPGLRESKATAANSLKQLADAWAKKRSTFDQILKHELSSYGSAMRHALEHEVTRTAAALASNDPSSLLEISFGLQNRYRQLAGLFMERAVPGKTAATFLDWVGNEQQPAHRIFAYLIAALGWRVSSGQSPALTAGILNDFIAIATYAPYVDAMFVDRQCASLLKQGRLRSDLNYKARIFSMSNKQEFLDYLEELADIASPEVRSCAHELYGVEL
ncbi:hypothetical protein [Bradyrhizobium sp. CER78]|uniref:hypothetical protein n=1 Tax=Bradyrhizobium sp. CER78 TaxID=3039162 RepID=UPI002449443E|nr:hypothetical protein [Bradyrhizobium sp. CER78]MDH2381447.1 hypothetical protein [Bradyrhizobium sp. CER78]